MTPDFLDELERQLIDATQRGARPRRRLHLPRFALRLPTVVGVGIAVTAVSATALAATLTLTHAPAHSHVQATKVARRALAHAPVVARRDYAKKGAPAGGPVPAGFRPESFTALGEFSWWLLGPAPCSHAPCTSIVRTTDGGRSFVGVPAPRTSHVTQLRFADEEDGYAFGDELWTTHDAGATWRRVRLHGQVTELAASGAWVYAVVLPSRRSPGRLMRSPVTHDDFKTVATVTGRVAGGLWVQGTDVLVETGIEGSFRQRLAISTDSAASFTSVKAPASNQCSFTSALPVIWALCNEGLDSKVFRSTDRGVHFKARDGRQPGYQPGDKATQPLPDGLELTSFSALGAATGKTAVVGDEGGVVRTTNGGRSYRGVTTAPGLTDLLYLGFTDSTHGVLLGRFKGARGKTSNRLYYTVNAGRSYHFVPIKGS